MNSWILVFIVNSFNADSGYVEPRIDAWWDGFSDMYECFYARESLGLVLTNVPGTFPKGTQAVCIQEPSES